MKRTYIGILATLALAATAALAQTTTPSTTSGAPVTGSSIEQRKDNQQQRIGNGVENGSLTAKEAGKIESQEKGLNTEERGMRQEDGGKLTSADKATLSKEIYNQKHDAQVQPKATNEVNARDREQQQRIGQGIKSGSLTPGEASKLENKEANLNKEEHNDRAANGGKLTPAEKGKINRQQNKVSKQIYKDKHNARRQK
jgi:hypothetical protein